MNNDILEALKDPCYSTSEAAKVVGIAPGRLTTWLDRQVFSAKTVELGPRRLLRRFDAHDLIMLATMVNLVDDYAIDVADAKEIAKDMQADASFLLMCVSSADPKWKDRAEPLRPNYYIISDGKVSSCFGNETIQDARKRIGAKVFTVFDATPAIHKAILTIMQSLAKELNELGEAAPIEDAAGQTATS